MRPDPSSGERNWPSDPFGQGEVVQQFGWLTIMAGVCLTMLLVFLFSRFTDRSAKTVTAYVSQDQVYAEPILAAFTRESGIKVRPVFDSEAVKTVAIANRLLAERAHPLCDVYWGNEELRTRQLFARGLFRETNAWAAIGSRSRRMVLNTNKLSLTEAPSSLLELTNARWRGRVALAYPLFGTTATHFLALRQEWGEAGWLNWCRALRDNQAFLVDGNSVAVKFVARGEAWLGLTDSDDIAAAQREGAPVVALPLGRESLVIPNTVAVVRGAPHPEPAQRLVDYLLRAEVVQRLVEAHALESAAAIEVSTPTLKPDWELLVRDLDPATESLRKIFLR